MFDIRKLQTAEAETLKTASGYEAGVVSKLLWSKHDSKINNCIISTYIRQRHVFSHGIRFESV